MTITTRVRRINQALLTLGQTYHPFIPLMTISACLNEHGMQMLQEDGTEWEGLLCGRDGRCTINLRDTATEEISRRVYVLALVWHKMEVTGQYEVTAYVS